MSPPQENKTKEESCHLLQKLFQRKMIHENEIFISAEQLMWPRCFLS